ncbi:MAG TPA: NUDIX domain-containing protein [Gillisia sp.]|nr:NUDIX domain-containing protein [Gillisia sp.]
MEDNIKVKETAVLSSNWGILNEITFEIKTSNGQWAKQVRESYDTGDGATVLLYDRSTGKVILTRQFRLPTYLNGNPGGLLTEACAGLLDQDSPEDCVIKEAREETGYKISNPKKVFEAYMSPGSVTEMMHFFIAEYTKEQKVDEGGGLEEEQEDIEVVEMDFKEAWIKVVSGELKDAKTIILLQHLRLTNILQEFH